MRHRRSVSALAIGMACVAVSSAGAVVRRVPSGYATINQALDVSSSGDSVLVAPGVYDQYETRLVLGTFEISSVGFLRSGVTLTSEAGAASTILRIDTATEGGPVVLAGFAVPDTSRVSGFTISGTAPSIFGVAFSFGGRVILEDCLLLDLGTGSADQGGISSVSADIEVIRCHFANINGAVGSAVNQKSGTLLVEDSEFVNCRKGALGLTYDASFPHAAVASVRRCRFVDNVMVAGGGGAISVAGYTTSLVEDSWFERNRCTGSPAVAGAIYAGGAAFLIRDNTFVENSAASAGAVQGGGPGVEVTGNTFWGNSVSLNFSTGGAAVRFENGGVLRNNVIAGSTGDEAIGRVSGVVQTACNVFWANVPGNATFPLAATDVIADPGFCDVPSNNFTVNATSPCLPGFGHPLCTDLIGAWEQGCGPISVKAMTWGRVKGEFRTEREVRR